MNRISLYLNIILLAAVGVLFYLHFASAKTTSKTGKPGKNTFSPQADTGQKSTTVKKIAYVNVDSLLQNYKLYQDLEKKLAYRRKKMESDAEQRINKLNEEMMAFEKKRQRNGFLTMETMKAEYDRLQNEQLKLQQYNQELSQTLMDLEQDMLHQLNDSVRNYLKLFNSDKIFDYILNANLGVLYADEGNNITDTVLKSLNRRYKNSLSGKNK